MRCAWEAFLAVVPPRIRKQVDELGKHQLQELRLRIGQPVELRLGAQSCFLTQQANQEDIRYVVNTASRYSPWATTTIQKGYITASGGHRIGLCGECVVQDGNVLTIRTATSLCMRVARSFEGIGTGAPEGSLLILGPPEAGKTTLLRDIIRHRSQSGESVAVVDERGELFPMGANFEAGERTDILTGCSKTWGVETVLRCMGPSCIALDEITAEEDCKALLSAGWCGVDLLATAHASNVRDLKRRRIYQSLASSGLFSQALVLKQDKTWHLERMELCT